MHTYMHTVNVHILKLVLINGWEVIMIYLFSNAVNLWKLFPSLLLSILTVFSPH